MRAYVIGWDGRAIDETDDVNEATKCAQTYSATLVGPVVVRAKACHGQVVARYENGRKA